MFSRFLRPKTRHAADACQPSAAPRTVYTATRRIDWRAARAASRSCCCPARPAIIAVMPPAPGRPDPVDLLLCAHHGHKFRRALTDRGAVLLDLYGYAAAGGSRPAARAVA